jgi:hypothetical protein
MRPVSILRREPAPSSPPARSSWPGGSGSDGEASGEAGRTATTAIERRDLVEVQTEDGMLGYADSRTVFNRRAKSSLLATMRSARLSPAEVLRTV